MTCLEAAVVPALQCRQPARDAQKGWASFSTFKQKQKIYQKIKRNSK